MALFEKELADRYRYFQGKRSQWEVRLLREKRGDKEALVDNPDFLNQHTDSQSTGLIALTPKAGQPAVWDLKVGFLDDVAKGEINYHFSSLHETMARYRAGLNPPIVSAVRYLIKAFQFGLEISPAAFERLETVIRNFDAERDVTPAVNGWLQVELAPRRKDRARTLELGSNSCS